MTKTLGICVTSTESATHVVEIVRAAERAGIRVEVFLTGDGVRIVRDTGFRDLVHHATRLSVCEVSARREKIDPGEFRGLTSKDFVTQGRHAEMVGASDRYLVF